MTDICCMKFDGGGVIVGHYGDIPCLEREICGVAFVNSKFVAVENLNLFY